MSAALEQSLDAIIASSKPSRPVQRSKKGVAARPARLGKKATLQTKRNLNLNKKPLNNKKSVQQQQQQRKQVAKFASTVAASINDPLAYSTKVLVHGIPKDIKIDSIKEFFSGQIGAVASATLAYDERGRSKGTATVTFKSAKSAKLAIEKYNNAPISASNMKLKIEAIYDPSAQPLAMRIKPNQPSKPLIVQANKPVNNKKKAAAKPVAKKVVPQQKKKQPKKKTAPKKKTIAELDAEMEDYFAKDN